MAKVIAINISHEKGKIKQSIDKGYFIEDFGLENDAHAGKWHRQVSLLGQESIDIMKQQGVQGLCSGKFAENITTEGIVLYELPIGTLLKIGETIQEVTQIGKECHSGCEISQQVGSCIMPKQGIFTKVIKGGYVYPNDEILIIGSEFDV
ncbi:MOSC domain-containing protein [Erysipelotrichaceae bacterium OttesenSCG-928-M19]|nr:MOSC domain-containing protein [Erysipelotrichaceae bacterium OttesenSCG-928-M19]